MEKENMSAIDDALSFAEISPVPARNHPDNDALKLRVYRHCREDEFMIDGASRILAAEVRRLREENAALRHASQANLDWHESENKSLGTFWERVELCDYSQWCAKKALGLPCDEEYPGIPKLVLVRKEATK